VTGSNTAKAARGDCLRPEAVDLTTTGRRGSEGGRRIVRRDALGRRGDALPPAAELRSLTEVAVYLDSSARGCAINDAGGAELRLQSYLRPLWGARTLRAMRESRAQGANRWQRPVMAIIAIGFPSRRSEPGRSHVVVLVAASW
jgi:hypothetical protein